MYGLILRQYPRPWGTPGTLRTEKGFSCDTLELPWAGNRRGVSCIMSDIYLAWLWYSPTMHRMVVRLEDKHGRKDCLIHNGNFAGDQELDENQDGKPDLFTQIHGCTEVGRGFDEIALPDGSGKQTGILRSKDTLAELVAHLGDGTHQFEYQWAEGCNAEITNDQAPV